MTIVGFFELAQFGVLVAVVFLLTLAVSLCVAMILDYMRDE
jgi:hypothetical protein